MVAVNYLWNPLNDNIVREFDDAGAEVAECTTEPDDFGNVVSQRRGDQSSYFHFDALGSTLALTDDSQQVTDTFGYTAFGEVTARTGSTVTPFQYVGQKGYVQYAGCGTYMARRRYLSAPIGRWQSVDPTAPEQSSYVYCNNSPLHCVDPAGLLAIVDLSGVGTGAGDSFSTQLAEGHLTKFYCHIARCHLVDMHLPSVLKGRRPCEKEYQLIKDIRGHWFCVRCGGDCFSDYWCLAVVNDRGDVDCGCRLVV